jgi:hypothetical protein
MPKIDRSLGRKMFFSSLSTHINRCLEPSGACAKLAIRAHSVQNAAVMDLLHREGHIKTLTHQLGNDDSFSVVWRDIGRNLATTFEGFCSTHDAALFEPIDTKPLDRTNREQLFLYAYRAVARELHASMEAAVKVQSMYQQRIGAGIDNGNEPEPAGMLAIELMMTAHSTYVYKTSLDQALLKDQFEVLAHEFVCLMNETPTIAASVFFDLDTRTNREDPPRVALNIFPVSTNETVAVFSFTDEDAGPVREYIRDIVESGGYYQKYLISRLLLLHAENFVVAPSVFDTWSQEKRDAILNFFVKTVRFGSDEQSQHLYLF